MASQPLPTLQRAAGPFGAAIAGVPHDPTLTVDLAGEQPVRPGFGRFTVYVDQPGRARRVQANEQYLIIAITRPGGGTVKDENNQDAVYSVQADTNGLMRIDLPGLPQTTSVVNGSQTPSAYVIHALVGNWSPFVAPTGYSSLSGAGVLGYGTLTGSTFAFDDFGKDLVVATLAANSTNVLLASGYGRLDVTAGVVSSVTLQTRLHLQKRFANSPQSLEPVSPTQAEINGLVASGSANVTVITNLTSGADGTLRLRHPAFNPDEVDATDEVIGDITAGRRVARMVVQTADGSAFGSAPALTVQTYDTASGDADGITPDVTDRTFSFSLANGQNGAFGLDQTMVWADADLSGPLAGATHFTVSDLVPAAYNVLDLTLTGLPAAKALKLYFLPIGSAYIMTGATTNNRFN